MQTIFFVLFNTGKSIHDRLQFFDGTKTLQEFFSWHIEKRNELEKVVNDTAVVENMAFIQHDPEQPDKHYGLYQLCPKCDGEGEVRDKYAEEEDPQYCKCPICKGSKLLIRPEIKPGE